MKTHSDSGANLFSGRDHISAKRAHHESAVTSIVCQPTDIGKWKHLLVNVEAVIDTTATYDPEEAVKVFNLVTEALKTVRPAYAAKLTYVETSGTWVHGHVTGGP